MSMLHCHTCPRRGPLVNNLLTCGVDGVGVRVHIHGNSCPLKRFDQAIEVKEQPSVAVPREQWPFIVKALAKLATAEDKGVGDTIARVFDPLGGDVFKRWYRRLTGHDCDCSDRRERLNAMYPY